MDAKTKYLCIIICPKKFKFPHNVFAVTELCRTPADILKPTLDLTLVASQISKIQTKSQSRSFGVDLLGRKRVNLYVVNLPQDRFKSNHSFLNLIVSCSKLNH